MKFSTLATCSAIFLFAITPSGAIATEHVSAADKVAAEAECLRGLGFEQGTDFRIRAQRSTTRRLGGKNVRLASGGTGIQFSNAIRASDEAMDIAEQCRHENLSGE